MLKKFLLDCLLVLILSRAVDAEEIPPADGFDYPVGSVYRPTAVSGDADGWNNLNPFRGIYPEKSVCMHSGDDWNLDGRRDADVGQLVKAIANGRVVRTVDSLSSTRDIGGGVLIEHYYKGVIYCSNYDHVTPLIESGSDVVRGETVAEIQDITDLSPHAHLTIREGACPTGNLYPHSGGSNCLAGYYDTIDSMDKDHLIDPTQFIDEHRVATWHPDGSLLRDVRTKNLYRIEAKKKRLVFASYPYFLEKNVITVSPQELYCYADGPAYNGSLTQGWEGFPEGSLIQQSGDSKVYVVSEGKLRWLDVTAEEFTSLGYQWGSVETVYSCFNFGEPLKFWQFHNQSCQNSSVSLTVSPNVGGGY